MTLLTPTYALRTLRHYSFVYLLKIYGGGTPEFHRDLRVDLLHDIRYVTI